MAERIRTIGLFKNVNIGAGSAGTSSIIDMRELQTSSYSVSYRVANAGASATVFSYVASPFYAGPYVAPTGGTFGTCAAVGSDVVSVTLPVIPFIRIVATNGSNGTAAANNVTAELHAV